MGFEIRRLIGDECVGRRVAFVKTITGKLEDHVPEFLGVLLGQAFFDSPCQEGVHILCNQRFFLLADRLDAGVRTRQGNVSEAV